MRLKEVIGAKVFISESEVDILKAALVERGTEFTPDQDAVDFADHYDEIASTLNAIIYRYWVETGAGL